MENPCYKFTLDACQWISSVPLSRWTPRFVTFGDNLVEEDDHLVLQASRRGYEKGLTIQAVSIRTEYQRQGHTRKLLKELEATARAHGLDYIVIESIVSKEMKYLAKSLEYQLDPCTTANYIKKIK